MPGEASLNTVNPVTDSQVWQSISIVWLVLLLAMLMSFCSTLHADIETSCRMGGLHISGSKRVSFDGTLSIERQARKVQRLRNEAAAVELVQVELGDLEPRSTSWMERPSVPDVMKARQASRKKTGESQQVDQVD